MKANDCIVIYQNQDTFKCILDGQEFSMTAEQLDELNMLFNKVANVYLPEAEVFKCAYVNEKNQVKVVMK